MSTENTCPACGNVIPADSPAGACMACAFKSAFTEVDDLEGQTIGPYTIIEQIGRGGFGVVYLAGQSTPVRRHVALKILSRNTFVERMKGQFMAEQQALAMMSHPNIAKIFDAGETDSGMPYFVMELIEGEPITTYCDRRKLTPRERIEIFRQVCSGIQHAHQKAIIHRDIKPANILVEEVDDQPLPKIIDFGIAKAMGAPLGDLSFHPETGRLFGTPEYMPPEQARGESDIDIRADIYSLGVLLYELLIGSPPFSRKEFEQAGLEAILNKIKNEDPPSPSHRLSAMEEQVTMLVAEERHIEPGQLRRMVRGDLDWIVMKALEKPRKLRYDSAGAFASDIDSYLANRPLPSRRGSLYYRMSKAVRRNRLAVSSAAIIALVILSAFLVGIAVDRKNARQRANHLVETLVNSRIERLPIILGELQPHATLVRRSLETLAASKDLPLEKQARAQLALIAHGGTDVSAITAWLLQAPPDALTVYLALLEDHQGTLAPGAWETLLDERREPAQRLNAAAICATLSPDDPRWSGQGGKIARWLVTLGAVDDPRWLQLFRPVSVSLVKPLRTIYDAENVTRPRSSAAAALAVFLQNDPDELVGLLETARGPLQLSAITSVMARTPDTTQKINRRLESPLAVPPDENKHREAARRRARLGLALLELREPAHAWPVLGYGTDAETRTQFIHGMADYSLDPDILVDYLQSGSNPGVVAAILIALGDYDLVGMPPARREALRGPVEDFYARGSDAGVRSAAEWLLRQWHMADRLADLDRPLWGQAPGDGRNWFLTTDGEFTMVLLPTPTEDATVGTPVSEASRGDNEQLVKTPIEHRVAIATKEVTVAQFMRFAKEMNIARKRKDGLKPDDPAAWDGVDSMKRPTAASAMGSVGLKEAALFCWWLTRREGLGDEQCYQFDGKEFNDGDPTVVAGYLDKGGYRLPTEAEWELACRGGTTTARYFGTSEDLLTKYAWYRIGNENHCRPPGLLRPNPFGLFDTLGNVTEWCQDRYWTVYHPAMAGTSFTIEENWSARLPPPDGNAYAYRGGSYLHSSNQIRAGYRNSTNYANHPFSGFRIARTIKTP